ncbi:MAG: histidine phosphatase family protein [Hyphomonas sp.]
MAAHLIRRAFVALMAAGMVAGCANPPSHLPPPDFVPEPAAVTRVFLLRHAEKEAGADPALTGSGMARAVQLAERLRGEGVTAIWSTATRRAQDTAAPLAAVLGLEVATYDAGDLPTFAAGLMETPGVIVVVGHSNTTDVLAGLVGADPGPPIDDAAEFDRLYVISLGEDGVLRARIERYGARSAAAAGGPP